MGSPVLIYNSQCRREIKGTAQEIDPGLSEEAANLAESRACHDAYSEIRRDGGTVEDYRRNGYEAARRRVAEQIPPSAQEVKDREAHQEEIIQFLKSAGEFVLPTVFSLSSLAMGARTIFD